MNPILIVISAAVVLSALSIALINKPRIPVVAGSILLVLIFFVVTTFFIDNAISDMINSNELSGFVRFAVMKDRPTYEELEASFSIFSYVDILITICYFHQFFIKFSIILKNFFHDLKIIIFIFKKSLYRF